MAGFAALVAAVATGEPVLAALGAPFIALAALGLASTDAVEVQGAVRVHGEVAVEGDRVEGEVTVDWDGEAEVDVLLAGGRGITAVDPAPVTGWALPLGEGPVTLPFSLEARSWGVHDLGSLWVRARRPGSLVMTEHKLGRVPGLRVLPAALRVSRLLKPAEPRAIAGLHVSRLRGHGTDLAELRPYQPGDRLRDLSWATSARLGEPWVRVNHPERTGTVVLVLDAALREEERSTEALARSARSAWAVASVHLRAQDRVGLLARGRTAAWLPPRGGRRARWMLLDQLLAVGQAAEDRTRRRIWRGRAMVPADALVVGVSTLRSETFVPELLRFRRAGHTTVALVIDTSDVLSVGEDRADQAALRIWLAQREAERQALERGGVPTALVAGDEGVGPAILTLRRRMAALEQPARAGAAAS